MSQANLVRNRMATSYYKNRTTSCSKAYKVRESCDQVLIDHKHLHRCKNVFITRAGAFFYTKYLKRIHDS